MNGKGALNIPTTTRTATMVFVGCSYCGSTVLNAYRFYGCTRERGEGAFAGMGCWLSEWVSEGARQWSHSQRMCGTGTLPSLFPGSPSQLAADMCCMPARYYYYYWRGNDGDVRVLGCFAAAVGIPVPYSAKMLKFPQRNENIFASAGEWRWGTEWIYGMSSDESLCWLFSLIMPKRKGLAV